MEKWNGFCEAAKNSSWKVKLSAVVMGGGQLLYGCWQKGLVYLLVELSVLYYFITRGISDLVGFFTLGTQKADPWTGTAGDNSVVMLLMGIFAWIVIAVFLCIYVSNLKDAYAIERRVKAGEQPISFKAELAQLLDRKFYITALALPVLGVCVFHILPIVFMILIAFTNYGGSIVPPELVDWVGFQNFAQLTTLSRFAPHLLPHPRLERGVGGALHRAELLCRAGTGAAPEQGLRQGQGILAAVSHTGLRHSGIYYALGF